MTISVKDIEPTEKLVHLIDSISKSGYARVSLYEDFTNMVNVDRRVPFIIRDLVIKWNVSLDEVSIRDLVNTLIWTRTDYTVEKFANMFKDMGLHLALSCPVHGKTIMTGA